MVFISFSFYIEGILTRLQAKNKKAKKTEKIHE